MIGLQRTLLLSALSVIFHAGDPTCLVAQPAVSEAVAKARILEEQLPIPKATNKATFELSPPRQERLQKRLPETFRRAAQREPLHLLALGNAEAVELYLGEGKPVPMQTFPAMFARELAAQFFYTGGVHEAGAADDSTILNPGITVRSLMRAGGSILDAAPILASTARQAPVNLVLLCYGQAEAKAGMSPVTFVRAVRQAIEAAHNIGAEIIVCAPWLPMSRQPETVLGTSGPLADALSEMAESEGLIFADLGNLARLLELPPNDSKDEAQAFERLVTAYRGFFYETSGGSFIPRASLHERLGSAVFKSLMDGEHKQPWSFSEVEFTQKKEGQEMQLKATVINESKERLDLTLLPLSTSGWMPMQVTPILSLPQGTRQTVTFQYAQARGDAAPIQEMTLRMPVLVISGKMARVQTLRAAVQPLAVVWSLDTLFNQEKRLSIGCQIINTSRAEMSGSWEAEFQGKKLAGKFDLKSAGVTPLDLVFDLPTAGPPMERLPLKLSVVATDFSRSEVREVTLTRNLGLKGSVPLSADAGVKGKIQLGIEADEKTLTMKFQIQGSEMLLSTMDASAAAWQIEVNLDARSYGKRLEAGSTGTISATGSANPGMGHVHEIPAWAFGTGYAASFDPKLFRAALSSGSADSHEITLSLPRTYMYLHEWALENGNSQLGLNVRVTLNTADGYQTWTLSPTSKPAADVEALAVLELSEKPTQRVTVDVH